MGQEFVYLGIAFKHRSSNKYEKSKNIESSNEASQEGRHCSDDFQKGPRQKGVGFQEKRKTGDAQAFASIGR